MIRRIRPLTVALLLCLIFTPALARDGQPRAASLDALHYRIYVEVDQSSDTIAAKTEILLAFARDGVKEVSLDFAGLAVDEVTENQRAASFTQTGERLNIALKGDYKQGDRCLLAVKYQGHPTNGLFIKKNRFGGRTIFADNWPNRAHYWFPSIDEPSDKATVEFFVTAPDRYDVIANGALIETTSKLNGTKLTHWSERVPIPTYCMVIGAAEFSIINAGAVAGSTSAIPLLHYLYPQDRDNGNKDFGRTAQMLEFFTNLIGPYPYEKLALVESTTQFGGMENSSSIFLGEDEVRTGARLEDTVAHEISHQWFGDSVTESDWYHLWLSEGFATYLGHIFFERADGRDKLLSLMQADKEAYLKGYSADPRPIYDPSVTDLFKLLNTNNYEKGGWVLHMLRRIMGDERFFAGIRDYYRAYRDRNALTIDFQRVMEFHAGHPLDWFFKQWIYEPGHPIYDAVWQWDAGAKKLRLRIAQKQKETVFRMPLDVEIKAGDATRREIVQMNEREQTFTFDLDARPSSVAIDPDEWVLKALKLSEGEAGK